MATNTGFKAFSNKANTASANFQANANETTNPDQKPPTTPPTDKPPQGNNKPK